MKSYAQAPWGWLILITFLIRVPFGLIPLLSAVLYYDYPNAAWINQLLIMANLVTTMLDGAFLFVLISWIISPIYRRKHRNPMSPEVYS